MLVNNILFLRYSSSQMISTRSLVTSSDQVDFRPAFLFSFIRAIEKLDSLSSVSSGHSSSSLLSKRSNISSSLASSMKLVTSLS